MAGVLVDQGDLAVKRALNNGISIETLVDKFEGWLNHYILINEFGSGRVKANIIRALDVAIAKLANPVWQMKLLQLLKERHPHLFSSER